ncbi:hypothetical protein, partial [Bradyrhizobium sp.]|uniref:hypothetical protein n=1 Tax=Bradyrhizobium sp. TaxID=376 RepID=UPI003C766C11
IDRDNKEEPIFVSNKTNHMKFRRYSIDDFLRLNIAQTKANGATFSALVGSYRRSGPRLPQSEIDRAADQFLLGTEYE